MGAKLLGQNNKPKPAYQASARAFFILVMGILQNLRVRQAAALLTQDPPDETESNNKKDGGSSTAIHQEVASQPTTEWKTSQPDDGDTALAFIQSAHTSEIVYTKDEEKRLVRKIDLMILPYLAVCYAFFYIDKTTLSYAAIFGIREDLDLTGDRYSWLSSIFYFGFLVWAFPTNFLMQKLPIGRYLGANIFMWGIFLMLQAAAKVRLL